MAKSIGNTDAALFEESNSYSYSMIVRDHLGELIEVSSRCKQGNLDPVMAEAFGVHEALNWVKKKECSEVVIEIDCLALVQAIRCSSTNLSYLGRVVNECKDLLLSLKQRNVTLNFVKRSANRVAYCIARNSSSLAERMRIWNRGNVHPKFSHVMLEDLKY